MFEDGKHLVVFSDKNDLQEKITHYLANPSKMADIAAVGYHEVAKYNRDSWARQIVHLSNTIDFAGQ